MRGYAILIALSLRFHFVLLLTNLGPMPTVQYAGAFTVEVQSAGEPLMKK